MEHDKLKPLYAPDNLRIAVVGGGNIGTHFACVCAAKGYTTNVCTSRPQEFARVLEAVNEKGEVIQGEIMKVTSDMGEAIFGCDVVFVTHPAFQLKDCAERMAPYVNGNTNICVVPGTGGAEFSFQACMKAGATLAGLQRVPAVARLERYGKRVRAEGLRDKLCLAAIPRGKADGLAELLSFLFDIPCEALPNYLSVTLTPSNPILHTTRLRTLFADYQDGVVYDRNPLFYGEWSDTSSELLIACDEELQQMCAMISQMDLTKVRSLKLHYESDSAVALTQKIRGIQSWHDLRSPMKEVGGGWVPDFESRYFTADFPYGLAILEGLADILNAETPNIRQTMDWYRTVTGDATRLDLGDYGIKQIADLCAMY